MWKECKTGDISSQKIKNGCIINRSTPALRAATNITMCRAQAGEAKTKVWWKVWSIFEEMCCGLSTPVPQEWQKGSWAGPWRRDHGSGAVRCLTPAVPWSFSHSCLMVSEHSPLAEVQPVVMKCSAQYNQRLTGQLRPAGINHVSGKRCSELLIHCFYQVVCHHISTRPFFPVLPCPLSCRAVFPFSLLASITFNYSAKTEIWELSSPWGEVEIKVFIFCQIKASCLLQEGKERGKQ